MSHEDMENADENHMDVGGEEKHTDEGRMDHDGYEGGPDENNFGYSRGENGQSYDGPGGDGDYGNENSGSWGGPPGFRGGFRGRGFPPGGPFGGAPPGFGFRGRGFPPGPGGPAVRGRGGFIPPPAFMRGRGGFPPRGFPPFRGGGPGHPAFPHGGFGNGGAPYGAPGGGFMQGQAPPQANPAEQEDRLRRLAGCDDGEELWVETESGEGKKYFYHPVNRNTVWELPSNAKIIDQAALSQLIQRASDEERKEKEERQAQAGGPPSFGRGGQHGNVDDAWSEFSAPDGRKYYYNSITQENTWEKPKALLEKERNTVPVDPVQAAAIADAQAKAQAALAAYMSQQKSSTAPPNGGGLPQSKTAAASGAAAVAAAEKKKDSTRPVSSTPVPGTPWCVVWTGDGKVFFYNPSTKTSVWDRPPETFGREDVDVMVSKMPDVKKDDEEKKEEKSEDGTSDSSDNDDDGPPKPKKSRSERKKEAIIAAQKKEKEKPVRQMLEKPIDPAVQAELEAQREREKIPLEERLQQFKTMLGERNVSTGSTFEKELSKIVFDKRYLVLSATERRACFEAYVREKTETERAEKKKKAKEAKEKFQELLKDCDLHGKSSFSSFSSKFGKDSRFKAVDKMRDREDMFNEFVGELHRKEKEEKRLKKEKMKADYLELLGEQKGLTRKSKWSSVKKTLEDEERYKALESAVRESMFRDFIEKLGDETLSDIEEEQEREKRLAATAAIAARQKEVEAELGDQLRERNKESERHRQQEHEELFKALLLDQVKAPDASWSETRRSLRKEERYKECDLLDKAKKEQLFEDHLRSLERKRRDAFYNLLNEHEKITPNMRWKDAKRIIQDEEETFSKVVSNSERKVERDFRDWQEKRHDILVNEFKEMLKETKIITYKTKKQMEENEQHMKDILAVLENDKRWVRMTSNSASERDRLLEEYIDQLHRKGTPPPPTQQEREKRRRE